MGLNHKVNGSCCHKELVETVKQEMGSSNKAVELEVVAEKILKSCGFDNPTNSQITECCKKLAEENNLNTCSHEKCMCIATDQITNLSTKFVEAFYKKFELSSEQKRNLEKGFYKVGIGDRLIFNINKDLFWNRLYSDSKDKSINEEARQGVGLSMNSLEDDKIFVATKRGISSILEKYVDSFDSIVNPIPRIDDKYIEKIKIIICYANSLGGSIDKFSITSTKRTPAQQADIMIRDYFSKNKRGLYGDSEKIYFDNLENTELGDIDTRKTIAREKLIENINNQKNNPITGPGFHHTNPNYTIVDIAPSSIASKSQFEQSLAKFKGSYLVTYEKPPKDHAYHLVFK